LNRNIEFRKSPEFSSSQIKRFSEVQAFHADSARSVSFLNLVSPQTRKPEKPKRESVLPSVLDRILVEMYTNLRKIKFLKMPSDRLANVYDKYFLK